MKIPYRYINWISIAWLLIGLLTLIFFGHSSGTRLVGGFFLLGGFGLGVMYQDHYKKATQALRESKLYVVPRGIMWEIHGGLECETCNLWYKDEPSPLDKELAGHPKGCKCQPCLRREAERLRAIAFNIK